MKIIHFFIVLLIALAPPIILLSYDKLAVLQFAKKSEQPKPSTPSEAEKNQKILDQGFKTFSASYKEEFAAHKRDILKQWGEFTDPPASVWLSYDESNKVRRSVDYKTGEVQVELIVDRDTHIDRIKGQLDKAVYRLMNSTVKDAFKTDVVASRVEQKLSRFGSVLQKGELSDERLFAMDDFVAIRINHDGYFKVSASEGTVAVTDTRAAAKKDKDIFRVSFKIPHSIHKEAAKYAAAVKAAANKEKIDDELIYAIMETESSFNPMAKSHVPAYGLMQIVPHTAGKDATDYLYGKSKILAPSYLYQPKNNITIGAAYLHVLYYKYLRKVKDKQSRIYCAIAAYNTGASNVAKAFIKQASFNKAVAEINKLSAQEVYVKLKRFLPQKEARNYVEKVSTRMEKYL